MNYETIQFEVEDNVAIITLNRPEVANALNLPMARELFEASLVCDERRDIRAILLTGAGRFFCGGGDLAGFAAAGDKMGTLLKEMTAYFHAAISRFNRADAPLVAAVNGAAGGAGFSLICATDIAIAAESAKFIMAYTAAGLTPDGSSTYFLPRMIGLRRAQELTLTNRRLTAAEAAEWGLINRVVADGAALEEARKVAFQLAQGPTRAYGAARRLMRDSLNQSLETQMEEEAQIIAAISATADAREGVAAFLEKRAPSFKGG